MALASIGEKALGGPCSKYENNGPSSHNISLSWKRPKLSQQEDDEVGFRFTFHILPTAVLELLSYPDVYLQFIWFNCLSSTGYGEPCVNDNDCYGAFSYESLSCVEQKCDCSKGYYLVGSSFCRRMGNGEWEVSNIGDSVLIADFIFISCLTFGSNCRNEHIE
jgi:hypothetical protein